GNVFGAMAGTDAAAVLIKDPIENVVATVLDDPMSAVDLENALRAGLGGRAAGDAVSDFPRVFPRLFVGHVPLDNERLAHVGKVEIGVECGGGPDFAGLDTSVIRGRMLDEVRLAPVLEVELQGLEKSRL